MRIAKRGVVFDECDLHFVQKFGVMEAAAMVLDFKSVCDLPFIYDTYQLADFLGIGRKGLFDLTRQVSHHYHPIDLPKKNGGVRRLQVPSLPLKQIQRRILREVLSRLPVSDYATAYRPGARLYDNAARHCGKKYLLKLDVSDFFGSIPFEMVYRTAFNTHYFPKQIGVMLTALCCRKDALPQGAPTSPALSNIVLRGFDNVMGNWCKKRGITYTRYCDDMTFSADTPLYGAYVRAKTLLFEMGLELNEDKTRFLTRQSRQTVTGLTVNDGVHIPADYKRALRQEVYYALKFGLESAVLQGRREAFIASDQVLTEAYCRHLVGKVGYVLQIEPNNTYFQAALEQLLRL